MVNGISFSQPSAVQKMQFAKNSRVQNKQQNVAFGNAVYDFATDSCDLAVKKSVNLFLDFMKDTATKAIKGSDEANKLLTKLIGKDAATSIVKDEKAFTEAANQFDKAIPLSGLGTRGKATRDTITSALNLEETHKATMPIPALLGEQNGEKVYLNTVNNELLHMMEAKVLSPFEKMDFVQSLRSDGDLSVIVKGLNEGKLSVNKPVLFTYTDDLGNKGAQDYKDLAEALLKEGDDSNVKIISAGFKATKEQTAGKLGAFFPNGDGTFRVVEKPTMDELNAALPNEDTVLTNIGKTAFTKKGLEDIAQRFKDNLRSLTKIDKGEFKFHNTKGALKPAGEEGTLKVIGRKGEVFADVGNGAEYARTMRAIKEGKLEGLFPEAFEKQMVENIEVAEDGKFVTLNYDGTKVKLSTEENPTKVQKKSFGEKAKMLIVATAGILTGVVGGVFGAKKIDMD